MLPIGPLMLERIIERMMALLEREIDRIERGKDLNAEFLDTAIDFLRTYVDRLHQGKEEDILFRELGKKALTDEDRRILTELSEEHRKGRKAILELAAAKAGYLKGDRELLSPILDTMRFLVQIYHRHFDKENDHFFKSCMQYLSREEKDLMLVKEHEFDRNLMHQIYKEHIMREEAARR